MLRVVAGALYRIAQDAVGLGNLQEAVLVAGVGVIGMVALREDAVDAVHRLRLRVDADLQYFVVIDRNVLGHGRGGCKPRTRVESAVRGVKSWSG